MNKRVQCRGGPGVSLEEVSSGAAKGGREEPRSGSPESGDPLCTVWHDEEWNG